MGAHSLRALRPSVDRDDLILHHLCMTSGRVFIFRQALAALDSRASLASLASMAARAALAALAPLALFALAQTVHAAGAPSPDTPPELAALMAQLAQRQHGHITYSEEHFIGVLDRPLKSSGELLYDAPGRLEKRTLLPRPESVVLENGTITAHRGKHTYVANLAEYPQLVPLIDSIRALLAGDLPALEGLFKVEWQSGSPDGKSVSRPETKPETKPEGKAEGKPEGRSEYQSEWQLRLTPRDPAMAQAVKELEVRGAGDNIHVFEIRQPGGDRSVLTLGAEIPG